MSQFSFVSRDIGGHPGEAGQHRNRGEERLRKNRRKEREGTGDSDTKSESSSRTGGKNAPKVDRKSAKDFLVGDFPVIESREFKVWVFPILRKLKLKIKLKMFILKFEDNDLYRTNILDRFCFLKLICYGNVSSTRIIFKPFWQAYKLK